MEEYHLRQIWKSSSKNEYISVDKNQLIKDFKAGMEGREHIVRRRDRREIIAAIVGIIGFGYTLYLYSNLISFIGSILGILSLVYIIFKLRNHRKSKFTKALFLPIHDQLVNQKQFMLGQFKLLNTVLYWASFPLFFANTLIIWGISKSSQPLSIVEQLVYKWEAKLMFTFLIAFFFVYIGWLNKKAAKVNWRPLIKQIETIINNLKNTDN
ncbi:hypothetical protein [Psychroserpens sp. SPM9]|uniref:hypothetical protein n=1 Tax=Psychroserpens sp. SPM9 TaxID=2975598 RepID=UPI0021A71F5A|nr:hypothetical protein [Psychroserpens sp. SPM9]MDG5491987.1 hypothetical protein [Psychroserpens sp. SPM9]